METIHKTKKEGREYLIIRFDPKLIRILTIVFSITSVIGVVIFYIKHL